MDQAELNAFVCKALNAQTDYVLETAAQYCDKLAGKLAVAAVNAQSGGYATGFVAGIRQAAILVRAIKEKR